MRARDRRIAERLAGASPRSVSLLAGAERTLAAADVGVRPLLRLEEADAFMRLLQPLPERHHLISERLQAGGVDAVHLANAAASLGGAASGSEPRRCYLAGRHF